VTLRAWYELRYDPARAVLLAVPGAGPLVVRDLPAAPRVPPSVRMR
jgi:hypothetical protein